jgi:capsular polysaccharide biosynthesis protein
MLEHDASNQGTGPLAGKRRLLEPSGTLKSPAFRASYPQLVNPELIDPGVKAAMERSWTRGLFDERAVEVLQLNGGYIVGEGLVVDDNMQIIANIEDKYSPDELQRALNDIERLVAAQQVPHFDGIGVVAKRRAANNYGHYLLYMMPMALLGKRMFGGTNPRYVTHRTSLPMQDVILRSLRRLGIGLDRVVMTDSHEPVHFEKIVSFAGLATHGSYLSPVAVEAVVELAAPIPPGPYRKLFVRRIPGWREGRLLRNEEAMAERLAATGFHVIEPGSLSLEEQISLFKGADHVAGSLGAGMTNIAFCRPGTNVALLSSGMFPDTFFWFIAMHRQLNYVDIRGDRATFDDPDPWRADFTIREADIQHLEALGTTTGPEFPDLAVAGARVLAHIHNVGDVVSPLGAWVGRHKSRTWIEGFAITLPDGTAAGDIEYQAVLGPQSLSPVAHGGTYSGTRGHSLPIRGLRVRLRGALADRYECFCSATFADGTARDLVPAEQACAAPSLAPLEAFRLTLRARGGLRAPAGGQTAAE